MNKYISNVVFRGNSLESPLGHMALGPYRGVPPNAHPSPYPPPHAIDIKQ